MPAATPSAAPANEPVLLRRDDGHVAILTLNRPKALNALSGELIDALQAELDRLREDGGIRVVVIEAMGRAFSPGHDLREVRGTDDHNAHLDLVRRCSAMMMSIRALPQPVIAKVHAIATAAGCQLVAACDLAVASSEATFGTHGVNNGLFCGTPSVPIGRTIGPKRALDMLLTGEPIDAATALRDGLVSRVVAPDQLDAETMKLARRIAGQSPLATSGGKAMFHKHMEMTVTDAYAFATEYMADAMASEDAREGIDAFIGKRPMPDWKGR
jgi:enoyl-CoA hydratase/carnithine racemase